MKFRKQSLPYGRGSVIRGAVILFFALAGVAFGQSFSASPNLDAVIEQAIQTHRIPGAVLLVGHQGVIIHRKAYGSRALVPAPERMTIDTIFDCASLTKVIATTSGMMKLFEQGKIRIADKVTDYLPEFQGGKSDITIANLMTHYSGLRPDLDLQPPWSGYDTGIQMALRDPPAGPPGVRFVYSDINFILLGEIVRRLSGESEPEFLRQILFEPLAMHDTMFNPPASLRPRIAPTEELKTGDVLRGVVHDPTSRNMGGVAGHAGLFSTADDLSRFCQTMLDKGEHDGLRLFSPLTIDKFTSPNSPPGQRAVRGLGWDIDSPFSGERGELFPIGSYGHTGFTGTSLWMDPASDTFVILLTNSVHPHLRPSITSLRGRVATIVAAAVGTEAPITLARPPAQTGLDVLVEQRFRPLAGKRIGLITNHTGVDREGKRNVDRMIAAGMKVTALFSPEHGISGVEDKENVGSTRDTATGIRVWSLYEGKNRRPTAEMLNGVDVLVFDIADVGARFYTYVSTMAYAMEEAARAHIPFYVLDRPNPITGTHVEGPMLDHDKLSFVGYFPIPLRHGMTVGELARMFNGENHIGADLKVIPVEGWQRGEWFDATALPWIDPSPNIHSLTEALLYPGIGMLEYSTNYSVGRGTDSPFEIIGADFIHGRQLAAYLNARAIPGVRVYPTRFQPASSHFAGKTIEGVRFLIENRNVFDSSRLGLELAA
ncbi:MAG: DUF1343 domain-containing protein, partial [Acidobacteriota bacterium]|nr:DUF1343 domain-containing protein [Acidobacteriota bacterium]